MVYIHVVRLAMPDGCYSPVAAFATSELAEAFISTARGKCLIDPDFEVTQIPYYMESP